MPKNERRLTPKRQQFCDEHAERLDATKAAIKALAQTHIGSSLNGKDRDKAANTLLNDKPVQ